MIISEGPALVRDDTKKILRVAKRKLHRVDCPKKIKRNYASTFATVDKVEPPVFDITQHLLEDYKQKIMQSSGRNNKSFDASRSF